MKTLHRLLLLAAITLMSPALFAQTTLDTRLYKVRGTDSLFLDIREPSGLSAHQRDSLYTVIFAFGGSFMTGTRDAEIYLPWFEKMNKMGYRVVSIDYRLGMKGKEIKMGIFHIFETADLVKNAVNLAVEDLFSATSYLIENSDSLHVATDRIVVSGSSAGAITALTGEWEICNRTERASVLPKGFNYAGVMAFAGAVISDVGVPRYALKPCPHLLLHGTKDRVVMYGKIHVGKRGIFGSSALADIFGKNGYDYQVYRFDGHGHEVAKYMDPFLSQELVFLDELVRGGCRRNIDAHVFMD